MATVILHEYIARIEALLHEEAYERVISLCQYGLRSYPRCVDFYRLLGQACLETGRPDDAADMFRRVLGVDPQNFIAHVGLGVVAEGIGAVDEALWQWERALELEPNHAAVRDEWQQLRAKRDNTSPGGRIKLNRAALGYVYLRGEQYARAAGEFRNVLAGILADADGKHERFDLQVALAEALYRGGRQREAGELCRQVLKILPNALKPNLILGDIDLETGREDEGRVLFEQAQVLDPENLLASQLLHPPVRLPKRAITLEEPDSAPLFPSLPEQRASRGLSVQEPTETSQTSEPISPEDEGLPDWLRTLRVHRAGVAPARVERFEAGKAPEWLQEVADVNLHQPPLAPALDVAPVAHIDAPQVDLEAHVPTGPTQVPIAGHATAEAELPDWLGQFRQPDPAESSAHVESQAADEKTPDWLAHLQQNVTAAPEPSTAVAAPETPVRAPEPMAAPIPDWLADLRQLGAKAPEPEPLQAAMSEAVEAHGAPTIPAAEQSDQISETKPEAPPALETVKRPAAAAEMSAAAVSPYVSTAVPEAVAQTSAEVASPHVSTTAPEAAAQTSAEVASPHVGSAAPEAAAQTSPEVAASHAGSAAPEAAAGISAEVAFPHLSMAVPEAAAQTSAEVAASHVGTAAPEAAAEIIAEVASPHVSTAVPADAAEVKTVVQPAHPSAAEPQPPAPEIDEQHSITRLSEEPELLVTTVLPAHTPREVTAFLDDSSASPSIESQEAPTGATEYQARLDLARVMKDIDLESALELYALMGGASEVLRGQAIAEVAAIAEHHPEAIETLQHLRAAEPLQPALTEPIGAVPADFIPPTAVHDAQPGAPSTAWAQSIHAPEAPSVASVPSEAFTDALLSSEGVAYLDDAAAPASIEAQVVPTGAAQYAARLQLARMLVDLDLDTALDQYELMVGAGPALLQQSIADLVTLSVSHAEIERTHALLDLLQGSLPQPLSHEASPAAPAMQTPEAPPVVLETLAPEAPESPAVSSATLKSLAAMDAASAAAEPIKTPPPMPVVSEEAMEAGTTVEGGQSPTPTLPVVDASLADADTSNRAPREAVDYLADSAAPASVATHAAVRDTGGVPPTGASSQDSRAAVRDTGGVPPTGAAGYQARLDLARAVKFIDIDEALEMYGQLVGAAEGVRQEAIRDLQALLPAHPRAQAVIARLQVLSQPPAVSHAAPEISVPEWLADAQTPAPSDTLVPPPEPVVAEEAMEEELVAPAVAEPSVPSAQQAHRAAATHEPIAAAPVEPVIEETATLPAHERSAAPPESIAAASVEPAGAEPVAPETPAPAATTHESTGAIPVQPAAVASAQMAHEALIAAIAPEGTVATQVEQQGAEPKPASTPREATAFLDQASAPPSVEARRPAPSGEAEPKARLERARALREISLQESAAQYQSLIDGGMLLPQIISDLQSLVQVQPGARNMRMLLAEALAQAGRHQEAVEQYRKLV